jgi:gentisate 1,2-dioxygenase
MTELQNIEELDSWLKERNLNGHWRGMGVRGEFRPFLWKWAEIYEGLMAATELVPMDQTGRRTIQLRNPSMGDRMSNTIHMSIQCVMPGEVAEAHKHNAAAVRFVVQGSEDAATVVNGEPLPMGTGDFITTPSNSWHDHYNHSDHPVIWLDGLDIRLTNIGKLLGAGYEKQSQDIVRPAGYSAKTLGHAKLANAQVEVQPPPFRYAWGETEETFQALKASESEGDPYNGLRLTYSNPMTGGATLPTFACEVQLLTAQQKTKAHRHISTTIYYCHQGRGASTVDGERLEWSKGDIFVVPPWLGHFHENLGGEDAILYSMDDYPALKALGLYQEEEVAV